MMTWPPSKTNKFGAKKVKNLEGRTFDSKFEHAYYGNLKLLELAGRIEDVEHHVRYDLMVGDIKICSYIVDFRVTVPGKGVAVIDTKGYETDLFRLKAKLFRALYKKIPLFVVKKGARDPFLDWAEGKAAA